MRFVLEVDVPALEEDYTEKMSRKVARALESLPMADAIAEVVKEATAGILGDDLTLLVLRGGGGWRAE